MALVAYTKTDTIALVDALPQLTNDPSPKDEQTVTVPCEDKLTQIADRSSIISEEKKAKACNDKLLTPKYSALAENKRIKRQRDKPVRTNLRKLRAGIVRQGICNIHPSMNR